MENKEFDKKIKNELQEKLKVPQLVEEKLNETYKKIDSMDYKSKKFNFSKISQIAASLVVIVFLAGNGIAYARGRDNIYSWVLNKIGIQKEYEEVKTEINQTAESNGIRITLLDCAYDSNRFIACYKVEDLEGKIKAINEKYQKELDDGINGTIYDSMFFYGDNTFCLDNNLTINNLSNSEEILSEQVSETEYRVYQVLKIPQDEFKSIEIKINSLNFLGEDYSINGNWNLKIKDLGDRYKPIKHFELDINKQIDSNLKINNIILKNSGMFGELERVDYSYNNKSVEDADYLFRVLDNKNNIIGEFDLPVGQVKSGESAITYKYMTELKDGESYKLLIYKNDNYDQIKSGKENPISVINFIYNN